MAGDGFSYKNGFAVIPRGHSAEAWEESMRRIFWGLFFIAMLGVAASGQKAFAQAPVGPDQPSLGDIARAHRERQQAQEAAGVVPKVITNKDLPAREPVGIPEANPADPMTQVSGVQPPMRVNPDGGRPFRPPFEGQGSPGQGFSGQGSGGSRGGDLRGRIQEQESRIAELQARIDRASATMHPNSTAQYEGPGNRFQARQTERIEMMQKMLERQKQRLAAMQDAARRGARVRILRCPTRRASA